MSGKVLEKIAAKYNKVMEGVKTIMGGRVLEYEAKNIFNEGKSEGWMEGKMEGKMETAQIMNAKGMAFSLIAELLGVTKDIVRQWLTGKQLLQQE